MTVIAAMRKDGETWIGSDSLAYSPDRSVPCSTKKTASFDGFTVGFCGSYRFGQILTQSFRPPRHSPTIADEDYMTCIWIESLKEHLDSYGGLKTESGIDSIDDASAIILYGDKIYYLEDDFSVLVAADPFASVGMGAQYAQSVMWALKDSPMSAREIVKKAVECAIAFSPGCGGDINLIQHDPKLKPNPARVCRKKKVK